VARVTSQTTVKLIIHEENSKEMNV
jgi:hypothetical protein